MSRLKSRYLGLSDQWRATLRSTWQTATGMVAVFALAAFAEAIDLLNGGTLEETLVDLSIATKALLIGLVGIANGLVALYMNRSSARNAATYAPPQAPPPEFP
jgi:hypothetical protein